MGASRAFLKSAPDGICASGNKETATRGLLAPSYGIWGDCEEWYITIRDSLVSDFGWNMDALGKSVFFWSHQVFDHNFGKGSRW